MRTAGRDPLDFCEEAWKELKPGEDWKKRKDGCGNSIPHVCLKIPTGGGKTLIATHAVRYINDYYNTGFVLWVMPSDAIYEQTRRNFKNTNHAYHRILKHAARNHAEKPRAKILERKDTFSRLDIKQNFSVLLLMLQASTRKSKEQLRMFREDHGGFIDFLPHSTNYAQHHRLKSQIPNLEFHQYNDRATRLPV